MESDYVNITFKQKNKNSKTKIPNYLNLSLVISITWVFIKLDKRILHFISSTQNHGNKKVRCHED